MCTSEHVRQGRGDDGVLRLHLDKPAKRNALDDATILGLGAFFAAPPAWAKVVVLNAEGEHFSAGLDLAGLLGGAIIIESVFTLPGLGRLAIDSVLDADLPVITATVLVAGFFIVVANIIVDLLYAVIDPRVRLS